MLGSRQANGGSSGFPLRWIPLLCLFGLAGCGSGGSGRASREGQLLQVRFPDPGDVNLEPIDAAPLAAPLNQQVVLVFSEPPDPKQLTFETVSIRGSDDLPVPGNYEVIENKVVFTPRLTTQPAKAFDSGGFDVFDAGLRPGQTYQVRVGRNTWPEFVTGAASNLKARFPDPADNHGVLVAFQTTVEIDDFQRGLPLRTPQLIASVPRDGASNVSPQLYGDPDQLFAPRAPFLVEFDTPLDPGADNLAAFQLMDLDDRPPAFPAGLPLGIDVRVTQNTLDHAVVEIQPTGILPFGHLLSLEMPSALRGISQQHALTDDRDIIATFQVAAAPATEIRDHMVESFDSNEREETAARELTDGEIPAAWNQEGSGVLEAGFTFPGTGKLGRFTPAPPPNQHNPRLIFLDTDSQTLPLNDGSTPDAAVGTVVTGGVFDFTEIDIPQGVCVEPFGSNPLVLSATTSVRIAGEILLSGETPADENLFDSANLPLVGGVGGAGAGRGGESHPLFFRGNVVNFSNLVSPPFGGAGWGPGNREQFGGGGGQCGTLDHPDGQGRFGTDHEIDCNELFEEASNGYKPPGGGGGSYRKDGTQKKNGVGNVVTDGQGNYIIRTPETHGEQFDSLAAGTPGRLPFQDDRNKNDFIGKRGELPKILGGQGGGAGGSALDSYYCGRWCANDTDHGNDGVCVDEWTSRPYLADSVGDARAGAGGGGGGSVGVHALGPIVLESSARIRAQGGNGSGGETRGCSNFAGSGGGGSGGAVILQSADSVTVRAGAVINAAGGEGARATKILHIQGSPSCQGNLSRGHIGAGGDGSTGIVQLQPPFGQVADVAPGAQITDGAWIDQTNTRNPSEFTAGSTAQSTWYDMGRTIRRGVAGTRPSFDFCGTDLLTGEVLTDADGFVLDPESIDIRVDYLGEPDPTRPGQFLPGLEPRANFIPVNASVVIEFQGADAVAEGSNEVDADSVTEWSPSAAVAAGMQFIRYRVIFDLAKNNDALSPITPAPAVQWLRVRSDF